MLDDRNPAAPWPGVRAEPDRAELCAFPYCTALALDADGRCPRHELSRFRHVTARSSVAAADTNLGRRGNAQNAQELLDQGFFPVGVTRANLEAVKPGMLVGWAPRPRSALIVVVFRDSGPILEERHGAQHSFLLPCIGSTQTIAPNWRMVQPIPATEQVPVRDGALHGPFHTVAAQMWVMPVENVNLFFWKSTEPGGVAPSRLTLIESTPRP